MSLKPKFAIRDMFFDSAKVLQAVDRARRKVLSRAGAFVRRRARSSIRRRKRASRPGTPPTNRSGLLRDGIVFAYDPAAESVLVGPVRLQKAGDAPHDLEHGGTVTITSGAEHTAGRNEGKRRRMAARPFMGPALAKEAPNFPDLWKNSVK